MKHVVHFASGNASLLAGIVALNAHLWFIALACGISAVILSRRGTLAIMRYLS